LGFLPTTSHTRDDETRRIDGSVHDWHMTGHDFRSRVLIINTDNWLHSMKNT